MALLFAELIRIENFLCLEIVEIIAGKKRTSCRSETIRRSQC